MPSNEINFIINEYNIINNSNYSPFDNYANNSSDYIIDQEDFYDEDTGLLLTKFTSKKALMDYYDMMHMIQNPLNLSRRQLKNIPDDEYDILIECLGLNLTTPSDDEYNNAFSYGN